MFSIHERRKPLARIYRRTIKRSIDLIACIRSIIKYTGCLNSLRASILVSRIPRVHVELIGSRNAILASLHLFSLANAARCNCFYRYQRSGTPPRSIASRKFAKPSERRGESAGREVFEINFYFPRFQSNCRVKIFSI